METKCLWDMEKAKPLVIARLHTLGIPELASVTTLAVLQGDYINLECRFPNGQVGKILDDSQQYLAAQVEIEGDERCYGIAADAFQIAVYSYGCEGADAKLVLWANYGS